MHTSRKFESYKMTDVFKLLIQPIKARFALPPGRKFKFFEMFWLYSLPFTILLVRR